MTAESKTAAVEWMARARVVLVDGKQSALYACSLCSRRWVSPHAAEDCCAPRTCERCKVEFVLPGLGMIRRWPEDCMCPSCLTDHYRETARAQWTSAKPIKAADYAGPVFVRDASGDDVGLRDEGLFFDVPELLEWLSAWREAHPGEPDPELYVYAAHEHRIRLDAAHIVGEVLEFEGVGPGDDALAHLQAALDAWTAQHSPTWHGPNLDLRVVDWEAR